MLIVGHVVAVLLIISVCILCYMFRFCMYDLAAKALGYPPRSPRHLPRALHIDTTGLRPARKKQYATVNAEESAFSGCMLPVRAQTEALPAITFNGVSPPLSAR